MKKQKKQPAQRKKMHRIHYTTYPGLVNES